MRNSLLKTDLLILLSTHQKIETKTLEKAYVQFVNKLQVFINNSSDLATSYFLIHYTRIELEAILKKDTTNNIILNKTLSIINVALECLKLSVLIETKTLKIKKPLGWTADLCNAVEIIYALFHSKCINNGEVTIKQLAELFEKAFNINLNNISLLYIQIRSRVGERTTFLRRLTDNLNKAMLEKDK